MIPHSSRRTFCKCLGAAGAALLAPLPSILGHDGDDRNETPRPAGDAASFGDNAPPENLAARGEVPRRRFGATDEIVSAVALGGHTFAQAPSKDEAIRIVREAIDAGITFMDNAWEYHEGRSEKWMGDALADGYRDKTFLMSKVCSHGRDKKVAMRQLEDSLRRLRTDHLDLWQIHEVVYANDPELHFAPDGAVEALTEAKKQGKVRFVGFTGHKSPAIHNDMLSRGYPFDAVQLPLCGFDANFQSFEREVLPKVMKNGMAALGMKSLNGDAAALQAGLITAAEARRYALSLPATSVVFGIDTLAYLRENLAIARDFTPMTVAEKNTFRQKCTATAKDGRYELYKTTIRYDGAIGREQHGFPPQSKVAA